MRLIGNILWHIPFFGFITAFVVFCLGLLLTLLVVTAPIGLGLVQYSKFLLTPYSSVMVTKDELNLNQNPLWQTYSFLVMLLYLPFGIIIAICMFFQIIGLCISIIGIPVAIPLAKSLGTYLNPVGKVCVPIEVADSIRYRR